ncbi:hypothetical protein E4J89_17000 [Arthrobacter sp. CAU 1506]|uniref:hypothetical protein n=1 Tax=Arthrobacter sp. CAU 1506 TaxID=2560052 RepID=UPI0010ABDB15|nr:hypothetical protein [Arthrobacter sp. CAU 1506]TJY66290.1 hypothetical protein E4J89_17000 [Arthrobacter sp. CAU 1506]
MELLAAALMVALTAIVTASRGQGKDTSILWASTLICISMVLNVDAVFILVDGWFGGRNYADLAANLLLLVGVYFLARAIHRAASPASAGTRASYDKWAKWGLVIAISGTAAMFLRIDAPVTSTSFMRDYGGQWAAGSYSAVQYIYVGAVMAAAGWTCIRFRRAWTTGIYSVAFNLIGLGCAAAVLLVIDVLLLDALHVLGATDSMATLSAVYNMLNSATFILLCTGLALPPAGRKLTTLYETAKTTSVLEHLTPVWKKAIDGNSGLTLDRGVVPRRTNRGRTELHRMIVEIQDALARDPSAGKRIGAEGFKTLTQASNHLERLTWRPH